MVLVTYRIQNLFHRHVLFLLLVQIQHLDHTVGQHQSVPAVGRGPEAAYTCTKKKNQDVLTFLTWRNLGYLHIKTKISVKLLLIQFFFFLEQSSQKQDFKRTRNCLIITFYEFKILSETNNNHEYLVYLIQSTPPNLRWWSVLDITMKLLVYFIRNCFSSRNQPIPHPDSVCLLTIQDCLLRIVCQTGKPYHYFHPSGSVIITHRFLLPHNIREEFRNKKKKE